MLTENRPGAGSTLGAAAVARAKPDGYLVSQMTLPALRLPFMQRMAYDPRRDFTPIIHLTGYTFGVLVRADSPWTQLAGIGGGCAGAVRASTAGAIPAPTARRTSPWSTWPSARSSMSSTSPSAANRKAPPRCSAAISRRGGRYRRRQLVTDGKLRYLNFWTRERLARLPEVPTLLELGYAGMVVTSPYGLVGAGRACPGDHSPRCMTASAGRCTIRRISRCWSGWTSRWNT